MRPVPESLSPRPTRVWSWLLPLVLTSTVLGAAPARVCHAQEISSEQKQRFAEAQRLYDEQKYEEALPKFKQLLDQTQSPNARLYVARCLRELGKLPEAYDEMATTVREAKQKAETEKKYEQTRDASASELALLSDRVGHVVIAITGAPSGVTVSLNGATLTGERMDTPITVTPGTSHIEVSGPGVETVKRDVEIRGGETKTAAIALTSARTAGDPKDPAQTAGQKGGMLRIGGIVVGSAGVASIGVFGALFGLAGARFATLEEECGGTRCTEARYADVVDEGKSFETGSFVMLGLGTAMIAAAVPMIILGGPEPSAEAPAATLQPVAGGAVLLIGGAL